MLGIVVALPWELKSLTPKRIPVGRCLGIADDVVIAVSGMGAGRACTAASVLVQRGAAALISWGCATGLERRLTPGMLILPERVIGIDGQIYQADASWHRRLYGRLSPQMSVETTPVAETNIILVGPAEKRALHERTEAGASDMETAAIARIAGEARRPFIAVRAVADTASTELPQSLFSAITPHGQIAIKKLLALAPFHRGDCLKIARLGLQVAAARKTLAFSRKFVFQTSPFESVGEEENSGAAPAVFAGLHPQAHNCKKKSDE